jgi:hypothetical protein
VGSHFSFVVVICFTAICCALGGSRLAAWIIAVNRDAGVVDAPAWTAIGPPATDPEPLSLETASSEGREPARDLYGNEVTDAVAKYTLDPAGMLYEEHAPQIELPRLGAPKS